MVFQGRYVKLPYGGNEGEGLLLGKLNIIKWFYSISYRDLSVYREEIVTALNTAIDNREEGLLIKKRDSTYQPDKRKGKTCGLNVVGIKSRKVAALYFYYSNFVFPSRVYLLHYQMKAAHLLFPQYGGIYSWWFASAPPLFIYDTTKYGLDS